MHVYLSSADLPPSERWRAAFPGGLVLERSSAGLSAQAIKAIWLSTSLPDWEGCVRQCREGNAEVRIVVMSDNPMPTECARALDLGARGYCHTLATVELMREIATVIEHGGLWVGPELMPRIVRTAVRLVSKERTAAFVSTLTPREQQVVSCVANGMSNKECAARLGITERTVKAHLASIFAAAGVRDRLQLLVKLADLTDKAEQPT